MLIAPLPPNELARLRALNELAILDTPAESGFDDLVRLAALICDAPVSLVSLVDANRQWFKARMGLDAQQTSRDLAFCAHAILSPDDILVVEDASSDPRFHDNPLVIGPPHIRFYAGSPLVTDQGDALGTLCVIDQKPRELDQRQRDALCVLSRQVMQRIEMRRQVRARRAEAQKLSSLFQMAPVAIALNRFSDGQFLDGNPELFRMTGYTDAEFRLLDPRALTPQEYADAESYQRALLRFQGRFGPYEKQYVCKDGRWIDVALNGALVKSSTGESQIWSIIQDVTERKRIERMKTEFVSMVSHELRTPLTSISGALGLAVGGALGELSVQQLSVLGIAYQSSLHLSQLIDELLDMDKLAAGKMVFDLQVQPLMPLLAQALESNQIYARQHKVSLRLLAGPEDVQVRVDAGRLQQVMSNLLSNAAKFSPPDHEVQILMCRVDDKVRIEVVDHGEGIPSEFRDRIFERFAQVDSSDSRPKAGTGLGLAITRELVEYMAGRVGFESRPGLTCFYVEFPVYQ